MKRILYFLSIVWLGILAACQSDSPSMISLGLDDTYVVERMKSLTLHPEFSGERYEWKLSYESTAADSLVATTRDYTFVAAEAGTYWLKLNIYDSANPVEHLMQIVVRQEEVAYSPYITRVHEYRPAPGQFVNELPEYSEGDTEESMRQKAEDCLAYNAGTMVTLGGYGGYIVVGFDHTIVNRPGEYDFKVLGNAFYSTGAAGGSGGSSEPGIVMVSADVNGNGIPDDAWYELAGSEYQKPSTIKNYEITYYRPDEAKTPVPGTDPSITDSTYVRWTDNQGGEGYLSKLTYHKQAYYPQWLSGETLSFRGTRLADNAVDESGNGSYYVLYAYDWGYADNHPNDSEKSNFNIDWAVDAEGNPVNLSGIDFVKIYTGVNQFNGWLGECSTEVAGVTDLHIEEK
ncbi:cell surface protein [Barnesiella viscericola]|uniref:cell surface protein n=1 Tax=Barnesiella viscericola TaxID=397865 RepID=UPI0025A3B285|nr:cell surface protein [Barnesiella viscericola]MDM8269716.1 cell surface protein [Barnesiella viscericola]